MTSAFASTYLPLLHEPITHISNNSSHGHSRISYMSSSSRPVLTHFLCIPLATTSARPQLQESLARFATETQSTPPSLKGHNNDAYPQVPIAAIRPSGAIHLTIGMMSLRTPDSLRRACTFLQDLDVKGMMKSALTTYKADAVDNDIEDEPAEVAEWRPLTINLVGLFPMQARHRTSSLYAQPVPLQPLLTFFQNIHDAFQSAGLFPLEPLLTLPSWVEKQRQAEKSGNPNTKGTRAGLRPLKLHATVVNTNYASDFKRRGATASGDGTTVSGDGVTAPEDSKAKRKRGRLQLNATDLIERYRDFCWARDVVLDRIAICEMGAKAVEPLQSAGIGKGAESAVEYTRQAIDGAHLIEIPDQEYREVCHVDLC